MGYVLVDESEIVEIKSKLDLIIKNQIQPQKAKTIDKNTRETLTIQETKAIYGYSYQYWRNKVRKEKALNNYCVGRNILLSAGEVEQLLSQK